MLNPQPPNLQVCLKNQPPLTIHYVERAHIVNGQYRAHTPTICFIFDLDEVVAIHPVKHEVGES